jgi:uncharacterized protein YndB with AHSA1/START domain
MKRMEVSHRFDADVETVYQLISDPDFIERKYADQGATDIAVDTDERGGDRRHVIKRRVTIDLPGFARKVMQPTNTVVQVDNWQAAGGDGSRVCDYTVEVQGVPSKITGTVTLVPDGDGTRQDIRAEVKVSIPLLGGKLEGFAVDSGAKVLAEEAEFTRAELAR